MSRRKPSPSRWLSGLYGFPLTHAYRSDVAYVDAGKGKTTLIFIHGLSSYVRAWERTCRS
jgi:pimeloyl-ACP methyl ester carboxylesterase